MATDVKISVGKATAILAALTALAGLLAYLAPVAGLPNRIAAAEQQLAPLANVPDHLRTLDKRMEAFEAGNKADHDVLMEIRANTAALMAAHSLREASRPKE